MPELSNVGNKRPSLGAREMKAAAPKKSKKDMNAAEKKEAEGMKEFDDYRKALKNTRCDLKTHFANLNLASREILKLSRSYDDLEKKVYCKFLAMLKKRLKAATTYKKENEYQIQVDQEICVSGVSLELYEKLLAAIKKAESVPLTSTSNCNGDSLQQEQHGGVDDEVVDEEEENVVERSKNVVDDDEAPEENGQDPRFERAEIAIAWCIENKAVEFNKKVQSLPIDTPVEKTIPYSVAERVFSKTNLKGGLFFGPLQRSNFIETIRLEYALSETLKLHLKLKEEIC